VEGDHRYPVTCPSTIGVNVTLSPGLMTSVSVSKRIAGTGLTVMVMLSADGTGMAQPMLLVMRQLTISPFMREDVLSVSLLVPVAVPFTSHW